MSSERITSLYEQHAREWDRVRGASPAIEKAWLDRFTSGLPAGARVLDLGCGSGQPIARYLLEQGFCVTGVDSSPTLISLCAARFPQAEWLVHDMRTLNLGRTFDGLIAWDSLFHLTMAHQRAMFPVFAAHAAPRARLLFTSGSAAGEAIGSWQGEPLYHASLHPDEYRSLLSEHGFEVVAHRASDPECGDHTVWLARRAAGIPLGGRSR